MLQKHCKGKLAKHWKAAKSLWVNDADDDWLRHQQSIVYPNILWALIQTQILNTMDERADKANASLKDL